MDKNYIKEWKKNRKNQLIELLGGKCILCGSTENLEFDHINPKKKTFKIMLNITYPIDRLKKELKNCQLLCHDCHRQKTLEKQEYGKESEHGTIWRYKKYKCRCDKCKAAMSEYNKLQRKRYLKELAMSLS